MATGNATLTEDNYVKMCNDLKKAIDKAGDAIKGLNGNLSAIMKGDSKGPYWNGARAKAFYSTAKGNLNNTVLAYANAADLWNKLYDKYIELCKKGMFS